MAAPMKSLGLERLGPAASISLAEELWDSAAGQGDEPLLDEAHYADLQARLDEFRDGPKAGSLWEVVKARLRGGAS
jgi:putative addiction module component (TIGR02574 family)